MTLSSVPPTSSLPVNRLAEGRAERQAAENDRATTRLREAQSALATLKQRTSAASDARKAAAKQKVDQIRARLQMLKMTSPVDPKAVAQLARELKAAVSAYAGTGGAPQDLADGTKAAAQTTQAEAQAGDSTVAASQQTPNDQSGQTTTAGDAETDAKTGSEPDAEAEADKADKTAATETNPYRRMAQEAEARTAETASRNAAAQADRDFLSEARRLADALKALARRPATARSDADDRAAKQAVAETQKAVEDASRTLGGGLLTLTV
ncbi:hypothetical protein [Brevundimonas sp. SORGH_AS_0993]|uniref:hypothetical protein n=1 Tax=Brevundimonas sp. SORGH_AS_0993 TaxID=3041794 RepID=UPI00278B91DB|nr:hypothetical protein [Brevundimonas sp. SORGH_AS_0993]MDQ1155356.1 hypothetical protein [Brevundimonas sp. SORGH_AS_0993]